MSDILIAVPGECVTYNHDGTITIEGKIPESWTYGITDVKFDDFIQDKVVGFFREPPNFKVITKIKVELELEGKAK